MIHLFVDYISRFIRLDAEEISAITSLVQTKRYGKGDVLLREGMVAHTSYFNLKGCVRQYYLIDGEEKTTFFYTENQFITSMRSFTTRKPSSHYLACLEDCVLVLIPYKVETELLGRYPKLEVFTRTVLEQEIANYEEMLSSYIISNPEQRYLNLLKTNPDLLQRVPLHQLASYIGVKPESLSRIRNRISKRVS